MLPDLKHKCPVCKNKIPFQIVFIWDKYINCNHCSSILDYTEKSKVYCCIPVLFFMLPAKYIYSFTIEIDIMILVLAGLSAIGFLAFFGKLEAVLKKEPPYTINDDLDNLKNSNSKN